MQSIRIAAAVLAAVVASGCLDHLPGAASPAAGALRLAVEGRVLVAATRIDLYERPRRLPGLCFLWSPAVPRDNRLPQGNRVIVTSIRHAGGGRLRGLWMRVAGNRTAGWIPLGGNAEATTRLQSLFRIEPARRRPGTTRPETGRKQA